MNKEAKIRKSADKAPPKAAVTMPSGEGISPSPDSDAPLAVKRSRKGSRLIILALMLASGWYFGKPWLLDRWAHVAINDARIATTLVTVSSEVRGRVVAIPVIAGDRVAQGTPLVLIDAEQAEIAATGAKARLEGIAAKRHQLQTQQGMIRTQITSRRAAAEARITTAQANHEGSLAALRNAQSNFNRIS